jgi:divalent metal cation (Fe/Co/Zn/Cd) transporter
MTTPALTVPPVRSRAAIVRQGRVLNGISLAYNFVEAGMAIMAGMASGSIALVGFGVDASLELLASLSATWRLSVDGSETHRVRAEFVAHRLTGISFLGLSAFVTYESIGALLTREAPSASGIGLVLAILSALIMPPLARAKRRVAEELGSGALAAEAQQTMLCSYLSWILLTGLAANAIFGWWWADPVAALCMVPIIAKEGWEAVRGRSSCACHAH